MTLQSVPALLPTLEHLTVEREPVADAHEARAAAKFREFMEALGLDMNDPNLSGTDRRVARSFRELFAGHYARAEPALQTFPNADGYAQAISLADVPFHSLCAHHFLPFFGTAHLSYVPNARLVGLSKLARVVEFYARRPQLQERMTEQIANFIETRLHPAGVSVVIQGRHLCMEIRGLTKAGLTTTTSSVRGVFEDERWRQKPLAVFAREPGNSTLAPAPPHEA
jgi:GTP cyclohydrolase I